MAVWGGLLSEILLILVYFVNEDNIFKSGSRYCNEFIKHPLNQIFVEILIPDASLSE